MEKIKVKNNELIIIIKVITIQTSHIPKKRKIFPITFLFSSIFQKVNFQYFYLSFLFNKMLFNVLLNFIPFYKLIILL
jgi:hypothetical protein